ncbi:MAG: AAA family ATPase [Actinomycetota bacterium]
MSPDGNDGGLKLHPQEPRPMTAPGQQGRLKDSDRTTRKPMEWWDRLKVLLFLAGVLAVLVWADLVGNPGRQISDALKSSLWVIILIELETIRQIHYVICEHSSRYYFFWRDKVFGRWNQRSERMNDWNRFRIGRVIKLIFVLVIFDLVLAATLDLPVATAWIQFPAVLLSGAPLILQLSFALLFGMLQFLGIFWLLSRGGVNTFMPDDIETRFSDVWGQDHVLARVKENMLFLEDPESIEKRGGYVPGGILLWGPPGTGKTLMAEAVAGETGNPFVFVEPGAFVNMFFGIGILKMWLLFRKLRKLALRYGGVIVFFDEADSLGNRGALNPQGPWQMRQDAGPWSLRPPCNGLSYVTPESAGMILQSSMPSRIEEEEPRSLKRIVMGGMGMGRGDIFALQRLLTEMSGLKKPRGFFNRKIRRLLGMRPKPPPKYRILVMMATNQPQSLDEALLRPGRIDRIYKVGYPSKEGRRRTYEGYFAKVPNHLAEKDFERLSTMTPYATGATIKDLVNESLIYAIRNGRQSISWIDVMNAKHLKDLGPPEDVEYIERERHAVAVHEACHAVMAYRVQKDRVIDLATIEKGGTYLGMVASIKPEDQFTRWRTDYEAEVMVFLASLAGERMFFHGDSSSGVSGDLEGATQFATLMEGYWGMGQTVAAHGVTHQVGIGGGGRPGRDTNQRSKELNESLGHRIEKNLEDLLKKTSAMLAQNRHEVLAVAYALETNKTIAGDDIAAVIEGRKGPLIDGRRYHVKEFKEGLEAYHEQALEAHEGHESVRIAMPALPVLASEGQAPSGDGQALGAAATAAESKDTPPTLQQG